MKTFNTECKNVFGKGLKKYGFKKVKGKYPYYVRCVGNEIMHVITFDKDPSLLNEEAFSVLFGVATVYRENMPFDESTRFANEWLSRISDICFKENYYEKYDKKAYEMIPSRFKYDNRYEATMFDAINNSYMSESEHM